MADNPIETMLADSQDAIGRAIVVLLRAQGCPSKGPFVAVEDWVKDDQGRSWLLGNRKYGPEFLADHLNAAFRLGRASIVAETTT